MMFRTLAGILVPFFGTTLGAGCVYLMRNRISERKRRALTGFAAGVMAASSVWSLILPAVEQCAAMGRLCFLPPLVGFWAGIGFMLPLDKATERYTPPQYEAGNTDINKMIWAVTLHNIPEGLAVGVVFAETAASSGAGMAAAFAFAIGIAIQNFPEGAIISMPLRSLGMKRFRAFLFGALSGAVEPLAAAAAFAALKLSVALMPYLLSFAAGAMVWVAVGELIPDSAAGENKNVGAAAFCLGASLMMIADVAC
ncbi:MAG: ZIP family metal transporter [Clostridia bacterium]|nr:ZIP family metal transporter [Clostridia bacterium]